MQLNVWTQTHAELLHVNSISTTGPHKCTFTNGTPSTLLSV